MLIEKLENKAFELRKQVLEMCIKAKTGHVTSSMSCVEILVALYYGGIMNFDSFNPDWSGRDRLILSKGQASPILYTILADLGFFDKKLLDNFAQQDGKFGVHLQNDVPGVELTTGSLGHGFGVAAGMALALKMKNTNELVFALLGDGELHEGSMWETTMFASHNKLNNLIAIVDRNYLSVTNFTEKMVKLEPLEDKFKSFGWEVRRINGHKFEQILEELHDVKNDIRISNKPLVIIADTVKGKGINHISNKPLWHGLAPKTKEDIDKCRTDLIEGNK